MTTAGAPARPKIDTDNVPVELRALNQWVVWRMEPSPKDPAKWTKVPYRVRRPTVGASSTDSATWASFAEAIDTLDREPSMSGVGFVVTETCGIVGVDLDQCITDRGALEPWASDIIDTVDTYVEITPSGRGLRAFAEGFMPEGRRKKGHIEMYNAGRFLTVTGDHWPDARLTVEPRTEQLAAVHAKYLADNRPQLRMVTDVPSDDDAEILDRARTTSPKFRLLFDHADLAGYPSQSEADLALCSLLVKAGADVAGVDRLFRQSRLMRPKWDERHGAQTYGERTISMALEHRADSNGNGTDPGDVRPFPVVRLLEGDAPEPPAVHIHKFAIDRDITLLAAAGGHGKSTILLTAAVGTVLGQDVFGSLPVNRIGPVLLVVPEDGQAVARMILDAIIEGAGLSPNDRQALAEGIAMIPDDESVNITRDTKRLQRTAVDHGAVMLIGDPLRTLLGGADENDNALASATCDTIRRDLCRGAGLSVMLAHHNRKPGKDADASGEGTVHDVRGGGGWPNGSRLVHGVTKRQNRITVVGLKGNRIGTDTIRHELDLSIEADPNNQARWLTCRLTDANAGVSGYSEVLTPGRGRPLNANELKVLGVVDDTHEPGKRFSWSAWREGSGLSKDTFRGVRNRLLDAGYVEPILTGHITRFGDPEYCYAITATGRHVLSTGMVP